MTNLTRRVYQTVGRHFATLSCVQRTPSDPKEKAFVLSGFLVDVEGVWFYITAGHILKDIRTSLDSGSTFDVWRLGDHTAGNKFKGVAIPYLFDIDLWLVIEDAEVGLDYAAVPLQDLYAKSLAAGGSVPIGKEAWGDHVTKYDFWALVGIPSETVEYDEETIITARVVLAPIIPVNEPATAQIKAQNQFYARLADGSESFVKDVDGMSGGPIFALKKINGVWKYAVIGVQSAWYRTTRTLAACPFSSFGYALEDVIRKARSTRESHA
jgi:hypothetical protein